MQTIDRLPRWCVAYTHKGVAFATGPMDLASAEWTAKELRSHPFAGRTCADVTVERVR